MRLFLLLCGSIALTSCARLEVDAVDTQFKKIEADRSLTYYSKNSRALSDAYLAAAKNVLTYREYAAGTMIIAAGAVALGGVFSTPTPEIARFALGGVAVDQATRRAIPKTALDAMFTGAKRLNCISTVAAFGQASYASNNAKKNKALSAATLGAMRQVHIGLYEGLNKEIPAFATTLGEFDSIIEGNVASLLESVEPVPIDPILAYLKLLNSCLADGELTNVKKE